MELVEGEDLSQRISRGAIPIDEALPIAKQIAEALEAAHEQGVVHRDLKPANIKVRDDGTVKVLDFGLAKFVEATVAATGGALTESATITTPAMTMAGVILGTAAYMSPEQAKGRPADQRSDVWAFGCVLYEMLAGKRAFDGEDGSDVLAVVLRGEPDWAALPAAAPPSIVTMLRRTLRKDARARLPHIAAARIEIDDARTHADSASVGDAAVASKRPGVVWWAALGLLGAVSITLGTLLLRSAPSRPLITRVDIATPPTSDPVSIALSPDGRKVLFVADIDGHPRLWIRDLNAGTAQPLAKTEDAAYPFWSPTGRSIGFFANGQLLRLDLDGGAVTRLAAAALGRGGSWNGDGTILFTATALGGLLRVADRGGPVTVATTLTPQQAAHMFPCFLPGGRQFLFFVAATPDIAGVYVGSLDSSDVRRIADADAAAVYDGEGHLLFVRQGTLYAQPFDSAKATLSGAPLPIAPGIAVRGGSANVTSSAARTSMQTSSRPRAASPRRTGHAMDDTSFSASTARKRASISLRSSAPPAA